MTIGYRVDRSAVRRGEGIELNAVVRNDSATTVRAMHIKIKQVTTWRADGHESSKKRTVASVIVPGSELGGGAQRAAETASRSAASTAESARRYVQQQLAAGNGTRYRIAIPRKALLSLYSANIQVSHVLTVKMKTTGFSSSPEVSTSVHIRPPEMASEARAGTVEQRATEDAPHSTIVGAHGDNTPDSGPERRAAMGDTIGRPQQQNPAQ